MALNKDIILDQDQRDVVEFALKHPYSILRMDMGMGKTGCAITVKDRIKNSRCLVIVPSTLTLNWSPEIEKFIHNKQYVSVFRKSSDVYYPFDSDFVVISYDLSIKFPFLFEWATMVVMDEGTALKTMEAKRTEGIHKLIYENTVPRVHILTGTPLPNRVAEFYSLIAICNYNPRLKKSEFLDKFPDWVTFADYFSFRREFEKWVYTKGGKIKRIRVVKWEGLQREQELRQWLKDIYISKKSKRKPINFREILVSDIDDFELLAEFEKFNDVESVDTRVKAAAALRKVPLTYKHVTGLVDRGEVEGPVIIFTDHRESAHALANKFDTIAITGEISVTKRRKAEVDFKAGLFNFIVCTFGVWSKGPNLDASNFIAMNDICWVPGDIKQAAFRIDRKTQTRPCTVDMILGSPQDLKILREVRKKEEVTNKF